FELTPGGIRRQSEIDQDEVETAPAGNALNYLVIGTLAAALSVSVYLNIVGKSSQIRDVGSQVVEQSIAVLPFSNRSTNPDNAIFVDGIHDDLLTNLAHIGALKVISRTSVMEYRDTTKNIRQIGDELDVATVLEGAVQRLGDNVRINVQLIDAATDTHLWASTYDRKLTTKNIFDIQGEIARQISAALQAQLTPTEQQRLDTIPTENMEAYNLYRKGRHNLEERQLETTQLARTQFEQAVKIDPNYSEAYSGLADSILLLKINHEAIEADEAYALAEASLNKSLALDPESADAYASLGLLKLDVWQQTKSGPLIAEAELAFQRALELNPNHARATMWYAGLKGSEQKIEEAIALFQRSLELDPLARIPYINLPGMYAALGDNQKAMDRWLDAVRLHPGWPSPYQNIANHLQGLGRFDESVAWTLKAIELDSNPIAGAQAVVAYIVFGDYAQALDFVKDIPEEHPFYSLGPLFKNFVNQNNAAVVTEMERSLNEGISLPPFAYDIAMDAALILNDLDAARKYLLLRKPALVEDALGNLDMFNVQYVIKLAYIAKRKGNDQHANELLHASLEILERRPRLGAAGHGIRDVQILALLNRPEEALVKLREAIDAGFRSARVYDNWFLIEDPLLASIRIDPQFVSMHKELAADVAVMHQRVISAEQSGRWEALRALASVQPVTPEIIAQ
ncbi:MAG: hypothetical protein HKN70_09330, partial [Gammaproteobacteria bacterium]|nr:hypothetical protein [Gammaproteobacteria bacterium]